MSEADQTVSLQNLSGLCLIIACIFLISCGGGEGSKNEQDLLKVFERGSGLSEEEEVKKERELLASSKNEHSEENPDESEDDRNLPSGIETDQEGISEEASSQKNPEAGKNEKTHAIQQKKQIIGPFTSVPVSKNRIISISSNREGEIFLAEKNRILRLEDAASLKPTEVLSPSVYELDTGEEMSSISHISSDSSSGLWLGLASGQLAHRARSEWKLLSGGPRFTNAAITAILHAHGALFVGGKGMFQWDAEFNRFLTIGDAKGISIVNIARKKNSLLVSSNYNLYHIPFPEKSFTEMFEPFREDVPLGEVTTYDNTILLGTRQGILQLSERGYPLQRFAEDIQVQKVFPIDDSKGIILSRQGSLHAYLGRKVFSTREAVTHAIAEAYLDYSGTLWISQKIPVLYKGNIIQIYKWIIKKSRKEDRQVSTSKQYPNACDAYHELIGKTSFSGNLSKASIDGRDHIFLKGQLICPSGRGTIRPDGMSILLTDWNISIHKRNSREIVNVPKHVPADLATRIFLDSRNRLYLATKRGLYIMDTEGKWSTPDKKELQEDYISDIKEDSKGNIWITSRIQKAGGETDTPGEYQPLHVLTARGWAHFGTREGLDSFGIAGIEVDEEETLLATSQGFARILPNGEVHIQGPREGFTRSIIEGITRDHYQRIWMGHGYFLSGMSWIKGSSLYLTTKEKGLFSDRIGMIGIDSKDRIWVLDTGGRTGVYSYNELLNISEKRPYHQNRVRKKQLLR
jgi:ligand-binding sensor domain-containing protein